MAYVRLKTMSLQEAEKIVLSYREFRDACSSNAVAYPPSDWSPYPPYSVAYALLVVGTAESKERRGGRTFLSEAIQNELLGLADLVMGAGHESASYAIEHSETMSAFSHFMSAFEVRSDQVRHAVAESIRKSRFLLPFGYACITDELEGKWLGFEFENSGEVIRHLCEIGIKNPPRATEVQFKQRLEDLGLVSQRDLEIMAGPEIAMRALAWIAPAVETGKIRLGESPRPDVTGWAPADWVAIGAMLIGYMVTTRHLYQGEVCGEEREPNSDVQQVHWARFPHRYQLEERQWHQSYWEFCFECYRKKFDNFNGVP